jgi:hypothetical protein
MYLPQGNFAFPGSLVARMDLGLSGYNLRYRRSMPAISINMVQTEDLGLSSRSCSQRKMIVESTEGKRLK